MPTESTVKRNEARVSLHGVALEANGIGILITGASGIGKTTSAIKAMIPGYFWIADDLAIIDRHREGVLMMTGHRRIQKYLHTNQMGIVEVQQVFPSSRIKNRTKLDLIVHVERTGIDEVRLKRIQQGILDELLPCVVVMIAESGYFNQNLLHQAIKHYQGSTK